METNNSTQGKQDVSLLRTKGEWKFTEHPKGSEFIGDIWADLGHPHIRTIATILDYAGKEEAKANAAYIVKACNAHEELVQIAKKVAFLFGNEANYPEGTIGYLLCKDANEVLMKCNEKTI